MAYIKAGQPKKLRTTTTSKAASLKPLIVDGADSDETIDHKILYMIKQNSSQPRMWPSANRIRPDDHDLNNTNHVKETCQLLQNLSTAIQY